MIKFFIPFFVLFSITSCLDQIQFDGVKKESFLVVDAHISDQPGPYTVYLSRSGFDDTPGENISDAEINILTDDSERFYFEEIANGTYQSDSVDLIGQIGREYILEIKLSDGSFYKSDSEKLLPVPPIEKIDYDLSIISFLNEVENIKDQKKVNITVSMLIPENIDNRYFKWDVSGEYEFREIEGLTDIYIETGIGTVLYRCYIQDHLRKGEISIFDGSKYGGELLNHKEIKSIDLSFKFAFQYCVNVKQSSLTRGAFEYWRAIKESRERSGSLFEKIPSSVPGNIKNVNDLSEKVYGYFYASSFVSDRLFIGGDSIRAPISPCIVIDPAYSTACMDCLSLPKSTRKIPSYWPKD
tara:strand:- start:662 stop:1726 length:1065 start_codon:yes stop_codon:yes gene_type:complete